MKKTFLSCLAAALLAVSGSAYAEDELPQVVTPEGKKIVRLSNIDPNLFVCDGAIKDVIVADDKGLSVKYIKGRSNTATITYKAFAIGGLKQRVSEVAGIAVMCGDDTFNIIATPATITQQTIYFQGIGRTGGKPSPAFGAMPYELKIQKALYLIDRNRLPMSAKVKHRNDEYRLFKDLGTRLKRIVKYEGDGIGVKEFTLKNTSAAPLELTEKQFLRQELSADPLAIAINLLLLPPGGTSTLYIVEGGSAGEN